MLLPAAPRPVPLTVIRGVSVRGAMMVGRQKIQVGLAHAGKTAEVQSSPTGQITVEPGVLISAPGCNSRDIRRRKASNYS